MKFRFGLALISGFAAGLIGCGGGGAAVGGNPTGAEVTSGPFVVRALGSSNAFSLAGSGVQIAGLYAATYNSVRFQQPPIGTLSPSEANKSTLIAFDESGITKLFDFGRGYAITPDLPGPNYANSTMADVNPTYDRIAVCPYYTTRAIQTANTDGSGLLNLTTGTNDFSPRYSPDGKKIAYLNANGISVTAVTGGTGTVIAAGANLSCFTWSPDSTKILFGTTSGQVRIVPAAGGAITTMGTFAGQVYSVSYRTADQWAALAGDRSAYVGGAEGWRYGISMTTQCYSLSFSPDGQFMVVQQNGVHIKKALQFDSAPIQTISTSTGTVPKWAPYMERRTFIGSSGGYGATCAGFLYGLSRKSLSSFLTVDSPVPGSVAFVKGDNSQPYQSNLSVTVIAPDGITTLRFQNTLYGAKNTPITSSIPAKGAIVVYDAQDGQIAFVLPFSSTSSVKPGVGGGGDTEKVYRGQFLGVWDRDGKNLSPNGASEVSVAAGGKSVRFR